VHAARGHLNWLKTAVLLAFSVVVKTLFSFSDHLLVHLSIFGWKYDYVHVMCRFCLKIEVDWMFQGFLKSRGNRAAQIKLSLLCWWNAQIYIAVVKLYVSLYKFLIILSVRCLLYFRSLQEFFSEAVNELMFCSGKSSVNYRPNATL